MKNRCRRLGWFILSIVGFWGYDARAGQALFQAASGAGADATLGGVQGVERFRFVTADLTQFGAFTAEGVFEPARKLTLNFFDDAVFDVELDRIETGGPGGVTWLGHAADPLSGTATLVFNDKTMSGSVAVGSKRFQIRNDGDAVHAIRELTPQAVSKPVLKMTSVEMEVYNLVNSERSSRGLYLYASNETLGNSARSHSQDMADNNYFSHTGLNGSSPGQRITAAGYNWSAYAENIAAGSSTAAGTMEQWMNSEGHRNNILGSSCCDLGVGYGYNSSSTYDYYWTQNFGKRSGVSTCPSITTYWWTGASELGGGWKRLSWFGDFYVSGNWTYHNEHGWLYIDSTTSSSMFMYDSALTYWWWTSQSVYPNMYLYVNSKWFYYYKGSKNPRYFYDYDTGEWDTD